MIRLKKGIATLFAASLLGVFAALPAGAASQQNGLVNVSVGNVSILNNASIGVAANVAATICGVNIGPVTLLATHVDATGVSRTVCTTSSGPVVISQA